MKKIKLFALAVCAMLSTNAFAAAVEAEQDYTYQGLVYTLYFNDSDTPDDATDDILTATVKSISDDETYTVKTTWEIPEKFKALATSGAGEKFAGKTFNVVAIGEGAFANNSNVKTITFAKAENIVEIREGAFAKTSIASLDLSGTSIVELLELFDKVNTKVQEIKLPATLQEIAANAFEGLSVLTNIDFTACENDITINEEAFLNTMALTTIEFPEVVITLVDGSFDGSYLTTVTFNGDVEAPAGSFNSDKLATIYFNADIETDGNIEAGAFERATTTQTITVNYNPSWTAAGDVVYGFDVEAFGLEGNTTKWATFNTTETFGTAYKDNMGWTKTGAAFGVKLVYSETPAPTEDPETITVYSGSGSYYYGTWYSTTLDIKIAKKQTDAGNVMVYGAYVDNPSDGSTAILMDQLMLIGGFYYIPAGTPVIVKASKNAPVVYTEDNAENSTKVDANGADVNQIVANPYGEECFAKTIINDYAGQVVYFLAPMETYGFLWSQFNDNTVVADYGFYVVSTPVAAPDRLKVIWLDGSEEDQVTAIKTVKSAKAENGAIFNLAGQKVNAAYKGVVIKDGKKYIQK